MTSNAPAILSPCNRKYVLGFCLNGYGNNVYHGVSNLIITGGEPLLQEQGILKLVPELGEDRFIQLETGGHHLPKKLHLWGNTMVNSIVFDYKLPSSKMSERMLPIQSYKEFFYEGYMGKNIWIKFVVGSLEDFDHARTKIKEFKMNASTFDINYAISPAIDVKDTRVDMAMKCIDLYQLMQKYPELDNVVLNTQLHKFIGIDKIELDNPIKKDFNQ